MNRDDIIRMARESGECQLSDRQFQLHGLEQITRFANIVAAAEREACAKVCDEFESDTDPDAGAVLAAAIRARGNT
jgi:dsDNA-specific endonuclease/ATPase MutS2